MRRRDSDIRHHAMQFDARLGPLRLVEERLFDEEDRMLLGEAREELLWTLPDESPAEMAEDDNSVAVSRFRRLDRPRHRGFSTESRRVFTDPRRLRLRGRMPIPIAIRLRRDRFRFERNHVKLLTSTDVLQRRE